MSHSLHCLLLVYLYQNPSISPIDRSKAWYSLETMTKERWVGNLPSLRYQWTANITWQFKVRQKEYFARLLGRTWDCREPGHTVCVPTEDGQHHRLSNENFAKWVNALVCAHASHGLLSMNASMQWVGEATLLQPPDGILMPRASSGPSTLVVRAVSTPPSHRRNAKSPMLCTTSSICDTFSSRLSSSGASGPGYYSGKAMEWLGKKCIHGIESAIIFKRCWQHEYRLKQLQASGDFGKHRDELSTCLGDALELSQWVLGWHLLPGLTASFDRFCYSDRVRERAWALARRVHTLTLGRVSSSSMESWTWVTICRICTIPMSVICIDGRSPRFHDFYYIHQLYSVSAWLRTGFHIRNPWRTYKGPVGSSGYPYYISRYSHSGLSASILNTCYSINKHSRLRTLRCPRKHTQVSKTHRGWEASHL